MDAENQYRAIHEKFSAMLDGLKKLLAKKREGGVIPPNETTSKAKTELIKLEKQQKYLWKMQKLPCGSKKSI